MPLDQQVGGGYMATPTGPHPMIAATATASCRSSEQHGSPRPHIHRADRCCRIIEFLLTTWELSILFMHVKAVVEQPAANHNCTRRHTPRMALTWIKAITALTAINCPEYTRSSAVHGLGKSDGW